MNIMDKAFFLGGECKLEDCVDARPRQEYVKALLLAKAGRGQGALRSLERFRF